MRLNLGCGRSALPGFVNVDRVALPGVDLVADLSAPLPFVDSEAEEIRLSHVLEHMAEPLPLMQELHRVAAPGASLILSVPYGSSDDAWADQTHVRPYFLGSLQAFAQPFYWRADYLYRGDWRIEGIVLVLDDRFRGCTAQEAMAALRRERNVAHEMIARLVAVKPIREPLAYLREPLPQIELMFRDERTSGE